MMRKVLLIGGASLNVSPYIYSYIEILEKNDIPYDYLYWNREDPEYNLPQNFFPYNNKCSKRTLKYKKISGTIGFYNYVKKHLKKNQYEFIIVFTIGVAILTQKLLSAYNDRIVIDIRDYSPICKIKAINIVLRRVVNKSVFVAISSQGFKTWLPISNKYVVSHNTRKNLVVENLCAIDGCFSRNKNVKILTIGQIRDYIPNERLISQLAFFPNMMMIVAGYGNTEEQLREYVRQNKVQNVKFIGRYNKKDEEGIVRDCDIINILTGNDINSNSLMSNRFYLSVLYRKPMIVTQNTYQADVVKKYEIGIVVGNNDDLYSAIMNYCENFEWEKYNRGCENFLKDTLKDIIMFESKLMNVIKQRLRG